jgi:hypothetical protein
VLEVLLSCLLLLLVLMIAAHAVFVVIGVRSLLTSLPVCGLEVRRDNDFKRQRSRAGILYIVFGSVMVVGWGWQAFRVARLLISSSP